LIRETITFRANVGGTLFPARQRSTVPKETLNSVATSIGEKPVSMISFIVSAKFFTASSFLNGYRRVPGMDYLTITVWPPRAIPDSHSRNRASYFTTLELIQGRLMDRWPAWEAGSLLDDASPSEHPVIPVHHLWC
jgi:hypothetical protein